MPGIDTNQLITVARALPNATSDGRSPVPGVRGGRYSEQYVQAVTPTKHVLADEGAYFVATNPTIGTGVAYALTTAFNDTTGAMFALQNTNAAGGKRLYLDYLKLIVTAVPTANTSMEFAVKVDPKDRTPTAGNVAITPVNVNGDDSTSPGVTVQAFTAAAITVPASGSSARTVSRSHISTGLIVLGDEYVLAFGPADIGTAHTSIAVKASTSSASRYIGTAAPVIVGPGQWAVLYMWMPSAATTAPSFEYELGFWVR